jgi:hypothetical protein
MEADETAPLPSRIEIRHVPQDGVTIDDVWVPYAFLEELQEQGVYDSQFGSSLGADRDVTRVLEARGLLERETRGGVHRGPALAEWMNGLEWSERSRSNTSSTPPVSSPPEAEPLVPVDGGEFGKFHVGGWNGSEESGWDYPVSVRCWICGSRASSPAGGDAVALEDLAAWARSHVCPPLQVNGGGCDR